MWKDFHRLPQRSDGYQSADNEGQTASEDITPLLILSAFLKGEARDAADVLERFLPRKDRVAVDTAKQARDAAEQLNTRSRMQHAYEPEVEPDMADMLQTIARSKLIKDSNTAAQLDSLARQQRQMFGEIERVQGMMDKVRSGDTSALLMELVGSSIPGMENMGNMVNMMNMMGNMANN